MTEIVRIVATVVWVTLPFTVGLGFAAWRASRSVMGFTGAQAFGISVLVVVVYALILERGRVAPWTLPSVGMLLVLGSLPFAAALVAQRLARRDEFSPRIVGGLTFGAGALVMLISATLLLGLGCVLARDSCL